MYLVCIMDWHSRCVLSWRLSNTLEADFCVDALEGALSTGVPGMFNTEANASVLLNRGVQISRDSAGAYVGNVFVERLWRSVKHEEVCLKACESVVEARAGIGAYLNFCNNERPHQALERRTPAQVSEEGRSLIHRTEVIVTSKLVPV